MHPKALALKAVEDCGTKKGGNVPEECNITAPLCHHHITGSVSTQAREGRRGNGAGKSGHERGTASATLCPGASRLWSVREQHSAWPARNISIPPFHPHTVPSWQPFPRMQKDCRRFGADDGNQRDQTGDGGHSCCKGRLIPPQTCLTEQSINWPPGCKGGGGFGPAAPGSACCRLVGHTRERGKKREQAGLWPAPCTSTSPKEGQPCGWGWKQVGSVRFRFTAGIRPRSRRWGQPWASSKLTCPGVWPGEVKNLAVMSMILRAGSSPEYLPHARGGHQGVTSPGQAMVVKWGPGWACKAPTKLTTSPPHEDAQLQAGRAEVRGSGVGALLPVPFAVAPIGLSPGWHWVGSSPRAAFISGGRGIAEKPEWSRLEGGGMEMETRYPCLSRARPSSSQQPSQTGKSLFRGGLTHPQAAPIPSLEQGWLLPSWEKWHPASLGGESPMGLGAGHRDVCPLWL